MSKNKIIILFLSILYFTGCSNSKTSATEINTGNKSIGEQSTDDLSSFINMIDESDVDKIKEAIMNSKEDYINLLEKLVSFNTITGNLEGSKKITALLKKRVEANNGVVTLHPTEKGVHFIARFKGTGEKTVLLYDHTDTVSNSGSKYRYDKDKDLAYAQGTADSKGSVAFLIKLIEVMQELKITPYKELVLFLDANEEEGSDFSEKLAKDLAKKADIVLQADTGRPELGIVTKRKATAGYTIDIKGIAGHAGNGSQATASAVTEAGYILTELNHLASPLPDNPLDYTQDSLSKKGIRDHGQFVPDNTINPTMYTNSPKDNVVAGDAHIKIDVRSFEQSELDRLDKEIRNIANNPHRKGISISVKGGQKYSALESKGAFKEASNLYRAIGKKLLNKDILEWSAGGVTPGNVMAKYSGTMLDSVGMDAEPLFEHSDREILFVNAYLGRMLLAIKFLQTAEQQKLKFHHPN